MIAAYVSELYGESAASALSELIAAATAKAGRAEIDALLPDRAVLYGLLTADAPKTRKNAARLLGALGHPEDGERLADALLREQTRFVVPSLLLALGKVGGARACEAVSDYVLPQPKDEAETKHCAEIAEALRKAKSRLAPAAPPPVYEAKEARDALLVAPEGFSDMLLSELTQLGFAASKHPRGALVHTKELQRLYKARCFSELLLPIAENVPVSPEAIARAAKGELTLPWRAELRGYEGDRRAFIRRLAELLGGENDPSHYALELRIECGGNACDVLLRPASIPDGRFAYRVRALPASIAPATAACLARLAADTWEGVCEEHADRRPTALDPFCGSGTMLLELSRYCPCETLLGSDTAKFALDAARENAMAAHIRLDLIQKDAARFTAKRPFDIVLSNMPFGNRVGTHESNEPLYRAFVERLPALLNENGVAVLYTAEYRLLEKCLKHAPGLTLTRSLRTEAGGLLPWVFVLQKNA